jgi:large subunit ribosomal protein L25
MKKISISVKKRTEVGKKSTKDLRKNDNVPCVMYGGAEILHFYAHQNEFLDLLYTPNVYIVEIDIEGDKRKAVMQAVQFHPVTDKIQHIDFIEIFDDRPVTINIPIELKGAAIGIKEGGKPRQKRRSLRVKGLPANLPDRLVVDITKVNIGDVVKVGDLSYPNLEILDPERSMVFAIVSSRVALAGMTIEAPEGEEGEEGAEAAEGEEGAEGAEGGDEAATKEGSEE